MIDKVMSSIVNIVFIAFGLYGIFILRKWHKISVKTEKMLEQIEGENEWMN